MDNITEFEAVTEFGTGPLPNRLRATTGLVLSTTFTLLIILANGVSLAAFAREKRLRTYNNYFIINLSVLDLMVGLCLTPIAAHTHIGYYPLSQSACKILSGITTGIVNASNFSVVAICIDRHQATYDPINHFMSRSKRKAVIINMVPWVVGLAFWLAYITAWEFIDDFDNGMHCVRRFDFVPSAYIVQNVVKFYLPFAIIFVLYLRIFWKIRHTMGKKHVEKQFTRPASDASTRGTDVVAMKDVIIGSPSSTDDDPLSAALSEKNIIAEDMISTGDAEAKSKKDKPISSDVQLGFTDRTPSPARKVSVASRSSAGSFAMTGRGDGILTEPSPTRSNDSTQIIRRPVNPKASSNRESTAETRKATRTLLLTIIAFVVAWLPFSIVNLVYSIEPRLVVPGIPRPVYLVIAWLMHANSLLNPISYTVSQPMFRATVIKMFVCVKRKI